MILLLQKLGLKTMQSNPRLVFWLAVAVGVLLLDQGTKWVVIEHLSYLERIQVLPFFAWVHWQNPGAAFSFLSTAGGWQRWFFVLLAVGFSCYLIWELRRLPASEVALGWVFSLILGGALGNLTDRLVHGYVTDFILFHYEHHIFPAFNVADSSLFCGAVLWIWLMISEYRNRENSEQAS